MSRARLHVVVMAGGAGTRFWPLSREARPKPLLEELAGRTLLAEALSRARRLTRAENIWLVCGQRHAAAMRRASKLARSRVLVEPCMRNTAAVNALAAHRIMREDPDAVLVVLSADHRIPDTRAFTRAIRHAALAAADGALLTLGVRPTRTETRYGYIRLGQPVAGALRGAVAPRHPFDRAKPLTGALTRPAHPIDRAEPLPEGLPLAAVHAVTRFVEKPDALLARRYIASGRYLWNAGIFVWRARALLDELARHAPRIARALAPLATARARELPKRLRDCYRRVPAVSIDHALLAKSRRLRCLPVDFDWEDIGTFRALAARAGVDEQSSRTLRGEAILFDAPGNLVLADERRPVVLLGVSKLAVVDAGDVLLVADLERSDELAQVVATLRRKGRHELL